MFLLARFHVSPHHESVISLAVTLSPPRGQEGVIFSER